MPHCCRVGFLALTAAASLIGCDRRPEPPPAPPKPLTLYPIQEERWTRAKLNPKDIIRLDKAVALYQRTRPRYEVIEKQRKNGVPASVVFVIHGRERDWSFRHHLHNGDPLTGRTKNVPAGRIPGKNPPYTFEESAEDALYTVDHMDRRNWRSLGDALQAIEAYNGLGYQIYHPEVPSPYNWAGTSIYERGKYYGDGKYSPTLVDQQLGCAAMLKRMQERGVILPF